MEKADCFTILQVSPAATLKEARKAYMRLVKRWHPDRFTDNSQMRESAQEKLKIINSAYEEVKTAICARIERESQRSFSKPAPDSREKSSDDSYTNIAEPLPPRNFFSVFRNSIPRGIRQFFSSVNDVTEDVAGERLLEGRDVYIAVNPMFHIMALGLFMAIGLNKGNATVLMPVPQVDAILESVERFGVRWLLGVPALYRMILDNDRLDQYNLDSLLYCFCGGDVLPAEIFNRWEEQFQIPIYQVYGSTEVGHVCYSRIDKKPKPGTIGLPLKSRECIIVDPMTLEPVSFGESGELLVSSPYTLKGYWNRPDETSRTCVSIDGKVYCRMGDFVSEDADGELYYVERNADLIKHKGYRVSASEVEAILQDHPTVIGACVVGVPDARVGERIKAIVVLKEDARGVGGADLIKWCRERLASYKVPAYIEFRDMLPKSKVGKLLRREIRDEERRRVSKDMKKDSKASGPAGSSPVA